MSIISCQLCNAEYKSNQTMIYLSWEKERMRKVNEQVVGSGQGEEDSVLSLFGGTQQAWYLEMRR